MSEVFDVTKETKTKNLNGHGGHLSEPKSNTGWRREKWKPWLLILGFLCFAGAVWGVAKDNSLDWPDMLAGCLGLIAALVLVGSGRR